MASLYLQKMTSLTDPFRTRLARFSLEVAGLVLAWHLAQMLMEPTANEQFWAYFAKRAYLLELSILLPVVILIALPSLLWSHHRVPMGWFSVLRHTLSSKR